MEEAQLSAEDPKQLTIGSGLINDSQDGGKKEENIQDELELAVGDLNSSGLVSKDFLDEMKNNEGHNKKPSGRFIDEEKVKSLEVEEQKKYIPPFSKLDDSSF